MKYLLVMIACLDFGMIIFSLRHNPSWFYLNEHAQFFVWVVHMIYLVTILVVTLLLMKAL